MKLPLSYIETWGTPELREAVAGTYERVDADHVLAFAGAEEALFWAMQELVGPGDHAVVTVPCYQAMETVTVATGRRRERPGAAPRGRLGARPRRAARRCCGPTTKLVAVNFPNNPTGYVPDEATFRELVALCDERGIRLFCDEVYRGIEVDPARTITQAADLSETAISLNVVSKSYGLPGPARRLARLPRPGAARAPREAQALHLHLQRRPGGVPGGGRPPEPRAHLGAQPRHRRRQPAALRRLLRPLGGPLRLAAAGGRLRLLPALQGRRRRGVLRAAARRGGRPGPAGQHVPLGDRRRPDGPLPRRHRQARASRRASTPSTASCGHRTKFAARERFRTAAVRYLLPLPAAVILGASGSRIYLVDGPRSRSYRGALGWNPHAFLRTHGGLCARRIHVGRAIRADEAERHRR